MRSADAAIGQTNGAGDVTLNPLAIASGEAPAFPGAERQVEFVGPPGVGKSTLYQAVRARLGKQTAYRTLREGRFIAARASLDRLSPLRRIAYRSAFQLPRVGEAYARRLAITTSEDSFRQALRYHGAFLECCIDMALTGFGDAFARFGRLPIVLEQLRDLHLWNRLPADIQILQEDAFVQKGWVCERQSREAFFSFVPKPAAVVLIAGPPDVIVERLRARKRTINAHVGLSDNGLHAATEDAADAFNLAAEVLRRRGVPILEVDAEARLSDTADHIAEFLRNRIPQQEVN